jgi:hypothetical protein
MDHSASSQPEVTADPSNTLHDMFTAFPDLSLTQLPLTVMLVDTPIALLTPNGISVPDRHHLIPGQLSGYVFACLDPPLSASVRFDIVSERSCLESPNTRLPRWYS